MLGPQIGINVLENHDLNYYKLLFDHLLDKLDFTMQRLKIDVPDFITISLRD